MKPSQFWSVFGALVGNVLLLAVLVAVRSYWFWYIACAAFVLSLINTGRELVRSDGS